MSEQRQIRVAIVRGSEWNTTPAVSRVAHTLRDVMEYPVDIYCWTTSEGTPAEEVVEGFVIRRYTRKMPRAGVRYFAMWPLFWLWLLKAIRNGHYTHLHVMNLDGVIPAVLSKPLFRHQVVYDIRDPWGMALVKVSRPLALLFRELDRLFSAHVEGILICMGGMNYSARYYGPRTARTVPIIQVLNVPVEDVGGNGATEAVQDGAAEDVGDHGASEAEEEEKERELIVNYSGRLSALRAGHELIDAVESLDGVRLHVYGKLNDPVLLRRFEQSSKVDFEGLVPHRQALEYLRRDDVTTLIYDPRPPSVRIGTSNKLFESLMLGKPYICTRGTLSAKIAEEYGAGWAVEYGNVEELRELLAWLASNRHVLAEAGARGRQAYEKHFRWDAQRQNIIDLYRYLMGDRTVTPESRQGWKKVIGRLFTPPLSDEEIDRFEI